jgi:hypothetical protein
LPEQQDSQLTVGNASSGQRDKSGSEGLFSDLEPVIEFEARLIAGILSAVE